MTQPTPTSDPNAAGTDDNSRREQAKAQVQQAVENLKAELATRLDQFLDEVGAMI